MVRVPDLVNLAVGGHQRDTEEARISLSQLRDIGCDVAAEIVSIFCVNFFERRVDRREIDILASQVGCFSRLHLFAVDHCGGSPTD